MAQCHKQACQHFGTAGTRPHSAKNLVSNFGTATLAQWSCEGWLFEFYVKIVAEAIRFIENDLFEFFGKNVAEEEHLRACALKPFSLHFFNPSFGLTNLDGRLLTLPVDTVTSLTLGHLARRKYS